MYILYIYIYVYVHIYIYIYRERDIDIHGPAVKRAQQEGDVEAHRGEADQVKQEEEVPRLRTSGVSTNRAAAKVTSFDGLGKKVRPGTFGKIKVG